MTPTAIKCVYCEKPLLDADHARAHVVNQCEASPSKKLADALEAFVKAHVDEDGCCGPGSAAAMKHEFGEDVADDYCDLCGAARASLRAAGRLA